MTTNGRQEQRYPHDRDHRNQYPGHQQGDRQHLSQDADHTGLERLGARASGDPLDRTPGHEHDARRQQGQEEQPHGRPGEPASRPGAGPPDLEPAAGIPAADAAQTNLRHRAPQLGGRRAPQRPGDDGDVAAYHRLRTEAERPGNHDDVTRHLPVDRQRTQDHRRVAPDPLVALDRDRPTDAEHVAAGDRPAHGRVVGFGGGLDGGVRRCRPGGGRSCGLRGRGGRLLHGAGRLGGGLAGGVLRRGGRLAGGCRPGGLLGRARVCAVAFPAAEQRLASRVRQIRDPQHQVGVVPERATQLEPGHRHAVHGDDAVAERDDAHRAVGRRGGQRQTVGPQVDLESRADGVGQRLLLGGRRRLAGDGLRRGERKQPDPVRGDGGSDATAVGMTDHWSLPCSDPHPVSTQAGSGRFHRKVALSPDSLVDLSEPRFRSGGPVAELPGGRGEGVGQASGRDRSASRRG